MSDIIEPVVFNELPIDKNFSEAEEPNPAPFEFAGAIVKSIEWKNRGIRRSRLPIIIPDANNKQLKEFKDRYSDCFEYAEEGKSEWEKILRMRHWLHTAVVGTLDNALFSRPYDDGENPSPFKMFETAGAGKGWWCPHFSSMLNLLFMAGGWASRKVGNCSLPNDEDGTRTHGVTDVFVNEIGKWVQMDAHFDIHYCKDGVPLSPGEIGQAFFENGGEGVERFVGLEENLKTENVLGTASGEHESQRAYWNRHVLDNNFLKSTGTWGIETMFQFIESRHEGKLCSQGRAEKQIVHSGYSKGVFHHTKRKWDVYPDVGTCRIEISKGIENKGFVQVNIGHCTPNFDTVLISINGKREVPIDNSFKWWLHEGENEMTVRTKNLFGRLGHPSTMKVVLTKNIDGDYSKPQSEW
ncbi:MAG: hypothetical protein COA79_16465 [Planctomycetota bacterium]|nr:MAG: hypothetical protein COA79_16465 [Planctomycetota bacterium]